MTIHSIRESVEYFIEWNANFDEESNIFCTEHVPITIIVNHWKSELQMRFHTDNIMYVEFDNIKFIWYNILGVKQKSDARLIISHN